MGWRFFACASSAATWDERIPAPDARGAAIGHPGRSRLSPGGRLSYAGNTDRRMGLPAYREVGAEVVQLTQVSVT
jgi:hypothetical protein